MTWTEMQHHMYSLVTGLATDRDRPALDILNGLEARAEEQGTTYARSWTLTDQQYAEVRDALGRFDAIRARNRLGVAR